MFLWVLRAAEPGRARGFHGARQPTSWRKKVAAICALSASSALVASAQTFKTVASFNSSNGISPSGTTLAQDRDGNLWGTSIYGGANGQGTVFKVTPTGTLRGVFNFVYSQGNDAFSGVVLGRDGNLHGATNNGGALGAGVVYKISPNGAYIIVSNLANVAVNAPLVQGAGDNFYGTAYFGGNFSACARGCGTVFRVTPSGTVTTIHEFDSADGAFPYAGLVQGIDGNFYGTTLAGGSLAPCGGNTGCGAVFRITPGGKLTVLHRFHSSDGSGPSTGLVQGMDGSLYGTTGSGGAHNAGTVFKIALNGKFTALYNFTGGDDGAGPLGPLVQGTDGNFYGAASSGGNTYCIAGCGALFEVAPSGVFTTLYTFTGTQDGAHPGALVQHTNRLFYGTTPYGGTSSYGSVFSLDTGLGPFVKAVLNFGRPGAQVQILGTGLTGARSVTFNGTATTFNVVSDTFLVATVPAGATTGPIRVNTPHHTLTSNVDFIVGR